MFKNPDILWLSTNPYLMRFNLPIIKYLSREVSIGQWEYEQKQDEGCSLDVAIALLDDYLGMIKKPVHLMGHSTGGLLGLIYTRKYPEKVKSLTLLGVGVNPAIDWVNYYYDLRVNLPCSREIVLGHMAKLLFCYQNHYYQKAFVQVLSKALSFSLSPHSLYEKKGILKGGISQPLMVCGSLEDDIVSLSQIKQWQPYLKKGDYIGEVSQGGHFFHYQSPQKVSQEILKFLKPLLTLESDNNLIKFCKKSAMVKKIDH